MLPERKRFPAPVLTSEGPFPLGPFPRHIWIHSNTPQDGLDKTCYDIWKRVQRLSEELQLPLLQHVLCPDLSRTLQTDTINFQSNNYLLDEPEVLESIYKAMVGNREREMKLRALCDAQLHAKPIIPSLLYSAKSPKNSRGLEAGSVTGTQSTKGSKLEMPFLLQHPDPAKGASNPVTAEDPKAMKELIPNSNFSYAKSSTAAASTTAEDEAAGQKWQLQPFAKICSKTDSYTVTNFPVTTTTQDKKDVKYNTSTSGFSATSVTAALNQPAWQRMSVPLFPVFPNHLHFPQLQGRARTQIALLLGQSYSEWSEVMSKAFTAQGPYHQRARIPYQQALHPPFGCFSRQVALYSPQQFFQPPYNPTLNYLAPVQPGYPYQKMTLPPLSRGIQDLPPVAGEGMQYPFSPGYGFSSRSGGAVATNLNYFSSESYVKF